MDIVVWLRSLGLGRYEAAFRENDIDETVLSSLTHENLKELGVASLGHRVKLLDAIAALRNNGSGKRPSVDAATTSSAPSVNPEDRAERRQVTGDVLRPCGLNGAVSAHGPRGPERSYFDLPEMRRRDCAPLWRLRCQIHGRRSAGVFRVATGCCWLRLQGLLEAFGQSPKLCMVCSAVHLLR
jgi:hypothetical protein